LAARTGAAFERLRAMLEQGEVSKTYLALLERPIPPQSIDLALSPSSRHRSRVEVNPLGRQALSVVERCWPHGRYYVVSVRAPKAYRHQVRVHLAAAGAPILGDGLYGGSEGPRHYLHACELRFWHPITGETVEVRVEPPADWPE
jgi:23S rRNA pseudouridine1911/1915/1917 synthase